MEYKCTLHPKQTLTSYCDTCKDAVCQICTHLGPHADSRHQIMSLPQASNIRQMFYLAYRDKQIRPLLQHVYSHLSMLAHTSSQLSKQRRVIQKDIHLEFQSIRLRVQSLTNKRTIKKQTQIKNYQEMLNRLQDLVYSFDGIVNFPQRFLLCYKQFHQQLKQLQTTALNLQNPNQSILSLKTQDLKAISSTWKVPSLQIQNLQIPREMTLSFAKANQLSLYINKNQVMNKLVAKSVDFYHKEITKAKKDILTNQKRILHIFNDQNGELLSLQGARVCAYCLTPFNMNEINEACAYNKSFKSQPGYKQVEVPVEVRGQRMHYWVVARKNERPIPDVNSHFLIRNVQKKQFLNSLKELKSVVWNIKRYEIQKGKQMNSFLEQFKKDDPSQKGLVSVLAFMYVLTNKFEVSQTQTKVLSQLCTDKESGMVSYVKMGQVLKNPLQIYRKFQQEQEEVQKSKPQAPPSFRYRY